MVSGLAYSMTSKDFMDSTHFGGLNENMENPRAPTFADLGIPTEQQTRLTIIGTTRTCSSLTKWEWLYMIGSVVALLTSMILTIYTMTKLDKATFDFTFALVLIYTTLFCFYYVVHGVLKERPFELMVFVTTIFIILAYSIMNYFANTKNTDIKVVRLVLVCILGPILIVAGILLSREYYLSGNLIYRTVGANINLQSMCNLMFFCSTFLKFDLQLQGSMILLVMENGTDTDTTEAVILGIGFTITITFITIGFLSMRFENKILVILFVILSISEPAYIIYLFYKARHLEQILYRATYLCGSLAIIIWIAKVVCMYFVARNFGKGLKEKVYGDKQTKALDPEVSLPSPQEDAEKPGD
ncbi:uncharacterized protein [Centruroides vittatus]|uniref:uncharacterized protein isoform X1 n=1 Tax=Centruroides vittatus TaxID=120091 RepID=UPI0035101D07